MSLTIAGRFFWTALRAAGPPAGIGFALVGLLATFPQQAKPILDAIGIGELTPTTYYLLWAGLFAILAPIWFALRSYPRLEYGVPRADYGEGKVHIRLPVRTLDSGMRRARITARLYNELNEEIDAAQAPFILLTHRRLLEKLSGNEVSKERVNIDGEFKSIEVCLFDPLSEHITVHDQSGEVLLKDEGRYRFEIGVHTDGESCCKILHVYRYGSKIHVSDDFRTAEPKQTSSTSQLTVTRLSQHKLRIGYSEPQNPTSAFIDFYPRSTTINSAANVSAISDSERGIYTIVFLEDLPTDNYAVIPMKETPRNFEVTGQSKSSVSLRFQDPEPDRIVLLFESKQIIES